MMNAMDKYVVEILATIMLDGCASTPQVMYADLSAPGRYDKVRNAAIKAAAEMQLTLTMETKSANELAFNQRASPPCTQNYWIRVSFGEAEEGADTEIKITCGQQTNGMGEDIFCSLIDPISRDHCQQMQRAIIKALIE